jgi:hypothetical protein
MSRTTKIALVAGLVLPVLTGLALATPGVGILSAQVHARGTQAEPVSVNSRHAGIKLQTRSSVDFVTQQIVIAPGGTTGWHSHPGPVLVTVKTGELTLIYKNRSCGGITYKAGESFVDRGDETPHTALNRTSGNTELWATYLVPGHPGAPFRLDEPEPEACGHGH